MGEGSSARVSWRRLRRRLLLQPSLLFFSLISSSPRSSSLPRTRSALPVALASRDLAGSAQICSSVSRPSFAGCTSDAALILRPLPPICCPVHRREAPSASLCRSAPTVSGRLRECEKEEKAEKLEVKKAIVKGNMDGTRIYAENSIRKCTAQMNYLRLSSRLDAIVACLVTQAKMQTIGKSMADIVRALDASLATGNLQKMSMTLYNFKRQFVNVEFHAEFMEGSMAGSTSLFTSETEVKSLVQQLVATQLMDLDSLGPPSIDVVASVMPC